MTIDFYDKKALDQISKLLMKIHKICIDNEFKNIEKTTGPLQPNQKLQLLLHDEKLAWLRPMSQLMSLIDGVIFQKVPIEEEQIEQMKGGLKNLFLNSLSDFSAPFNKIKNSEKNLVELHDGLISLISDKN